MWDRAGASYEAVAAWARAAGSWSALATARAGHGRVLVHRSQVEPAIEELTAAIKELTRPWCGW